MIYQYRLQKDDSTNCDRNLEYSIKVNVNKTFNAFNILDRLVFFNSLKSNGLNNLTDQRLMEVTFRVTIYV